MNLKYTLFAVLILLGVRFNLSAQNTYPYQSAFENAYQGYPAIPEGMLEAISFCQTRMTDLEHEAPSCLGIPAYNGVMGLVMDGENYFNSTQNVVAGLAGVHPFTMGEPAYDIMQYAKAYAQLMTNLGVTQNDFVGHEHILRSLSEIPQDDNPVNDYALSAHTYQILNFLRDEENQATYGFPNYDIDMESIYGAENLSILSAKKVMISEEDVEDNEGHHYEPSDRSFDYAPALWVATPSCNFSSRNGTPVSAVTVHTVQGSYAGAISWAQNCNANVSYHYVIRSTDGQVTQMVYEADKGWHVGSENPYTIGIEHEGYVDDPSWYTVSMYNSSADLVGDITQSGYGINPLRTYYGPSSTGLNLLGGCTKIKGHQHYPNQSHTDPGINWDWEYYYQLINDNPSVTSLTTTSGVFYDSGGAGGNYSDDERELYLIEPGNVLNVTIQFDAFSLETDWDYMYVYDGSTTQDPVLGVYTGTSVPSTITSSGGSILLEFRSDCATQDAGWEISWTSVPGPTPGDNIAPTTSVNVTNNWKTTDFTANFSDADNSGGSGVDKTFYQVIHYNGTEWRANQNNGFFSDNFDNAIHPDWTSQVGTWTINSAVLEQNDEVNTNTNLWADLNQDNYDQWLYHFQMNISGAGGNKRAGFHFMCDDPTLTNRGNSYFIWLREDDDKIQIYKVVSDVFTLEEDIAYTVNANQWYDIKTVFDKNTGLIQLYIDDVMEASWVDTAPHTTGNSVSFRSGDAILQANNLKVYHNRGTSEVITVGTGNDAEFQNPDQLTPACKVKSIVIDSAANVSAIGDELVDIDWTAPTTIATVNDGVGADINSTTNNTTIYANWTPSVDTHSDLESYSYAIGTSPMATDIVPWTYNWFADTLAHTGLMLNEGDTYYVCVYAKNGAGLFSDTTCSDGQTVVPPSGTPTADFIVPNSYICSYEAVQVQNSSIDAQTYSWSAPGATPSTSTDPNPTFTYLATGYYDITLTATGTGGTDTNIQTIFVNIDTVPVAAFTPSASVVDISNAFVTFTNDSEHANGFTWSFGDGDISNDVSPWHEYTATGMYTVELVAVNGLCPNDTASQVVEVIDDLGISADERSGIHIYPHPLTDVLQFTLGEEWNDQILVQLYDARSRLVYEGNFSASDVIKIDLEQERVGDALYFLQVSDGEKVVSRKIIAQTR